MSFHAAENHPIKYLAVYNDLKEAILSGKYLRGSFLPTEVELTELYSVSRTTVRKAVSLLQSEKLVNVQQGRGTEVISGKSQVRLTAPQIYRDVIGVSSKYLVDGESIAMSSVVDIVPADTRASAALELALGTPVYRVRRLKVIGNTPFNYVVSYVPRHLAPGLEKFSGQVFFLYQCLKETYHVVSVSVDENIAADTAKFLESNLLGVPVGAPLLVTYRTAHCEQGRMEYTESYIRPDIYQISISMQGDLNYMDGEVVKPY